MSESAARHGEAVSWIYKIDGEFAPDEDIPPEAIAGAWPLNAAGEPSGAFIPNPRYVPRDAAPTNDGDALPPPPSGWVKA